jgi:hypothetical protein
MFRALLAHLQLAAQTALGILRAEISKYLNVRMYIAIKTQNTRMSVKLIYIKRFG